MQGFRGAPVNRQRWLWAVLAGAVLLAACRPEPAPLDVGTAPNRPTEAVAQLVDDLRRNDLNAYARHAVPPALHARLGVAWSQGRTLWPLTLLPLDEQLPAMITALAEPDSEQELMAVYNRQFAGATRELRATASALGLFAAQYINNHSDYSDAEREHYVQLAAVLSQWGQQAPLSDRQRAGPALARLAAAARETGLAGDDAFAAAGLEPGLERMTPFIQTLKQVLADYGLDLDAALDSVESSLVEQTGDRAQVRLRYVLAGQEIDVVLALERHDDRWYLSDLLRHAENEAGPLPSTGETDAGEPDAAPDGTGADSGEPAAAAS
ncbi:hypothetical protein [Marilutibacter alkalisoli]|uniref:DUF3828 domain-containing protein n=1 Tax=Marilutibacter alkalisoli TaxID=2591633 RepID=A0A514BW34_9GAMM|nr:hypothetical protein [Lysobacter alkalisoli]QDH71525.1 hypothetical protein FKV23_16570 [Lysobacter alkalisoli]